ncbi:unnamed protein product, partial [Symbiodinium microadriaticum]
TEVTLEALSGTTTRLKVLYNATISDVATKVPDLLGGRHPHLQAVAVAKDIPAKKEEDESAAGYEFKNLLSKNMPASPDDMVLNKFAKRVNRRMFKPIEVRVRWEGRFQHVTSFQARPFWTLFDFKVYLVKRWLWQEDRLDAFTVINWREPNRGQDTKLGKFKLPYFIMMDNLIRTTFPPNPPESPENRSEDAALPMPCLAPALQAAESKKRAAPEPPPRPSTKKIRIYLGLDGHFVDVQDGFASRSNGWSRIRKHPETQVVLIRDNSGSDPEQQWYSPTESSEDSESRSQQETQLVERTADSAIVRIRFPWIHGAAHNAKDAPHTHGGTSSIEPSDADLALDDYEDMIATIKGCGRSPRSSSPVPDAAAAGRGSYHDYNNATINPWVRNSFNASRLREDQPPDVMQKNHQGSSPFEMPRELRRRTAVELKTRSPERMRPNVSECKVADHASPPVGLSPQQADGAPNRIEVKQIAACGDAFAAILANGSVLTNAATHAPTKGVQNIQATRSYHDYNNATINPWVRNSFNASRLREVKLVCTGETNKLTAEERQKYRCHPLRQQAVRLADRITRLIWSTLSQSIQRWWRPAQVMDMIQDVLQVQLHFVEKEQLAQMTDDLLESAATLSWQLETSSSAASRRQQHRTGFMSASMPRITLTEYLQHLYRQLITRDLDEAAPLPCSVLVTAAALLQRLQNAAPEVFHPFSLRRLWATAFTLAYAWLADSSIHWPTMAALTGLQNGLDLERTTSLFLQLIDWRCFVSQETYQQTCLNIAQSTFPRPRLSRPREEPVALADQDRHATSAEPSSKDDNDEPVQQQTEKGESRDVEAPEPYTLDRHVTAPPKASRAPVFRRKINLVLATLAGRSRETTVHKYISLAYFSQKDGSVLNVIQIRQTKLHK